MVVVMPVMPVMMPVVRMGGGRRRHRQRANGRQGHNKRLHVGFLDMLSAAKPVAHSLFETLADEMSVNKM
jgi:hypothetical protein